MAKFQLQNVTKSSFYFLHYAWNVILTLFFSSKNTTAADWNQQNKITV